MAKEALPETKKSKPARRRKLSDAEEVLGTHLMRIDPDEDFSDVDGDPKTDFALSNTDPNRKYHWASQSDIGNYKSGQLGYKIEHYEEGGVFATLNDEQRLGERIEKKDLILVSCDKAKWQKRNRYEHVQTLQTNEAMIKKLQRTRDMRRELGDDDDSEMRA